MGQQQIQKYITHVKNQRLLEDTSVLCKLPYIPGLIHSFKRILRSINVKVVAKAATLHSILFRVKDAVPTEQRSNVCYRHLCSCGDEYVGETKKRFEQRTRKHQDDIRLHYYKLSALAEHLKHYPSHFIDWSKSKILSTHAGLAERKITECFLILMRDAKLNRKQDYRWRVSEVWLPLLMLKCQHLRV